MSLFAISCMLAYLMGSLSSAIIVCKIMKLPDPRTKGSHNPGATNVLRFGGKKLALIVLIADALKGTIPVWIAAELGVAGFQLAFVGLIAFLGHLYPVFFQFKGGKGAATAYGVLLGLSWWLGFVLIATWIFVAALTRYSSLAALTAATLAPVYVVWLSETSYVIPITTITIILIYKHKKNINSLLKGKESKLSFKK